jgi:acetylornithine deacetylase/succinyl-diaminopimelate desuccinylase-like protein
VTGVSRLAEAALHLTGRWCRIPSVRGDDAALGLQAREIADWLRRELGCEIVSDEGNADLPPVIHARVDVGAAHTVILYNMYDVMPADHAGWHVDPFQGGIVDLDGVGPSFVARGAENNKGPLAGMLCVLKSLLEAGQLKVNVEVLVEGQEESGSRALRDYLLDTDCRVRPSRAGLFPSFCEYGGGPPRLYLGFSGIAKGEVCVEGGRWGGPSAAVHSSNAPWIANPAWRLVEALTHFGRAPTGELETLALDTEAQDIVSTLASQFDPQAELRFRHSQRFATSGDALALLTRVLTTASVTLSGLATQPPDGDAVIPSAARARFDVRCPPPLDPTDCIESFRQRLVELGLEGVAITIADSYAGSRFPRRSVGVEALLTAYAATSRQPQIWPWAIGAAPAYAFARHAESFLIGGAGRGGNAHGVNEFMTLEGFERFLRSVAIWLDAMGHSSASIEGRIQ